MLRDFSVNMLLVLFLTVECILPFAAGFLISKKLIDKNTKLVFIPIFVFVLIFIYGVLRCNEIILYQTDSVFWETAHSNGLFLVVFAVFGVMGIITLEIYRVIMAKKTLL